MTKPIHKDAVLEVLRRRRRALHLSEVCEKLRVPKDERDRVLDMLEEVVSLGLATELPGRRFRANRQRPRPAASPQVRGDDGMTATGRLTMHPSGFGFVAPEEGGADVFIPPPAVGGAMHGDKVRLRVRRSHKGFEGDVIEVLERRRGHLTGVFRRAGGNAWIDPDDPRMRGPMAVMGKPPSTAQPGIHVIADVLRFPRDADDLPEVTILDVLGTSGVTAVEVAKLKIRDGVVEEFDPDVLAEAATLPDRVTRAERAGREDLRDLDLTTIDPSDARDHDDAVWGTRLPDGGYRVIVAIADVSHYVQPGTAIDKSAFERGCSIYLPDRAIPMLPAELSTNLASLVAKKDRLTLAVEIELGPSGAVREHRFIDGIMRSKASLTYEGVARALGLSTDVDSEREAEQRKDGLQVLLDLSRILRSRRMRRGSLDFDLPEGRVRFEEGEPVDVYRSKGDAGVRVAYQLVEEMMLLANEVVASDMASRGVPTIYRVHGAPDEQKLLKFVALADALGHRIDPDDALKPRELAKFLRKLEGKPEAQPLGYLLLRAMQQAQYDTTNIGHFGLGSKFYLHFTSPIRRYPDLEVHRMVRSVIRGDEIDHTAQRKKLKISAIEGSRLERRAMMLERDIMDLYRAVLMQSRIGEEHAATVNGIAGHGLYSTLDQPFLDVHTPAEAIGRNVEVDELGVRLSVPGSGTHYTLGDRLKVRIEDVSIERREVIALPIGEPVSSGLLPAPPEGEESDRRPHRQPPKARPRPGDTRHRERRARKDERRTERKSKGAGGSRARKPVRKKRG
jgi:ribonuclease R